MDENNKTEAGFKNMAADKPLTPDQEEAVENALLTYIMVKKGWGLIKRFWLWLVGAIAAIMGFLHQYGIFDGRSL